MISSDLVVEVAEDSLDRVSKILSGIPGGVHKAVGSALARAAQSGRTIAARAVSKEYVISQGQFQKHTRNINHFQKNNGSSIEIVFGFRGAVIPLIQFDTTVNSTGRVQTRVMRASAKETLDKAFVAKAGKHTGLFERETYARLPIRELFGPSTTQMMYSNEAVMDEIDEKMAETYEKRIEVEITRILNGYGG